MDLRSPPLLRYIQAIIVVVALGAIELWLDPAISGQITFVLLIGAIMFTTWYAGLGPGLVVTGLGTLISAYLVLPPIDTSPQTLAQLARLILFIVGGVFVVLLTASRRNAKNRLQASEERYRLATQAMNDTVWDWNMLTGEGKLSGTLLRRFGYSDEESGSTVPNLYEWWLERVHPEDVERVTHSLRNGLQGADSRWESEYRFRQAIGTYATVVFQCHIIRDVKEKAIRIVGVMTDVSEYRLVQEALHSQRRWLEEVLHLAPTPILLIESGTARVIFSNKAADKMAGGEYPRGKRAEEYHTVYYCTDREGMRIPNEEMPGVRVARGERLDGYEMDWHTPEGKRSLRLFGHSIPAMPGHPATAIVMFQDISAIKQIEEELRTANCVKDEFLATLSHELRTPLNAIIGWAKVLTSGKLDEAGARRALQIIERNSQLQAQLIEDILDMSGIITGRIRLSIRSVDIRSVLESAIDVVSPAAEAKEIRIDKRFEWHNGLIPGDPDRLQQVVWNLLSNAVKFTPRQGRIKVHLERQDSYVKITVSDTGEGISHDFISYVFERFRQADGTTRRSHGGLGLGLAIVHHLVELHGGTVEAESEGKGMGATFRVLLPFRAATSQMLRQKKGGISSADEELDSAVELTGLRVLVVDDEADACELLANILQRYGAEVIASSSARDAFEAVCRWVPDIMVADIGMPEEDGYDLIRQIRESQTIGRNIPAVALTSYASVEDRQRALGAGFQVHLAKPVDAAKLVSMIASLSGRG